MPIDFRRYEDVDNAAKVHNLRPREKGEDSKATAKWVSKRDRIESFEILSGIDWDRWTDEQKVKILRGDYTLP